MTEIYVTINVVGKDLKEQKKVIQILDNILLQKAHEIPEGVTIEFKNTRTRDRKPKVSTFDQQTSDAAVAENDQ